MNKKEFESRIEKLNVKKVKEKGIKSLFDNNRDYYIKNELNIYGIYKKDKDFVIFFKDSERGIITELGRFEAEEDAYEELYNTINSWEDNKEANMAK